MPGATRTFATLTSAVYSRETTLTVTAAASIFDGELPSLDDLTLPEYGQP